MGSEDKAKLGAEQLENQMYEEILRLIHKSPDDYCEDTGSVQPGLTVSGENIDKKSESGNDSVHQANENTNLGLQKYKPSKHKKAYKIERNFKKRCYAR